jgi:hypothetical protein
MFSRGGVDRSVGALECVQPFDLLFFTVSGQSFNHARFLESAHYSFSSSQVYLRYTSSFLVMATGFEPPIAGQAVAFGVQTAKGLYGKFKCFWGDIQDSRIALEEHETAIKSARKHLEKCRPEYEDSSADEMENILVEQARLQAAEESLLEKDEERGRLRYVVKPGSREKRSRSISRTRAGTQKIDRARFEHRTRSESRERKSSRARRRRTSRSERDYIKDEVLVHRSDIQLRDERRATLSDDSDDSQTLEEFIKNYKRGIQLREERRATPLHDLGRVQLPQISDESDDSQTVEEFIKSHGPGIQLRDKRITASSPAFGINLRQKFRIGRTK